MNAVEGFFLRLSRQRLKNAVSDSLDECIASIEGCIEHHNANDARPFRWSRKPEDPRGGLEEGAPEAAGNCIKRMNQPLASVVQ